jgi:hypothetical protein
MKGKRSRAGVRHLNLAKRRLAALNQSSLPSNPNMSSSNLHLTQEHHPTEEGISITEDNSPCFPTPDDDGESESFFDSQSTNPVVSSQGISGGLVSSDEDDLDTISEDGDQSSLEERNLDEEVPCTTDHLDITHEAMVDLMLLCESANVPLGFLDKVLCLLRKHIKNGFDIQKAPTRSTFLKDVRRIIPNSPSSMSHTIVEYNVTIRHFDFLGQLEDLQSSTIFDDIDNICVIPSVKER